MEISFEQNAIPFLSFILLLENNNNNYYVFLSLKMKTEYSNISQSI